MNFFKNKDILVTGGCGSIGSEIVKQLLKKSPTKIRVYDSSESGLFHLQNELNDDEKLRFFIGDVRDKERLKFAMKDVDVVFHAAALKHVPLCEYNPFEAMKTNVVGTQNIINTARELKVENLVYISTDKAVNPISTMGTTKLLGEKLISDASLILGTKFTSVRFGNVLGSDGSVIPLFESQIKKGGPVTLTSYEMTRFFMSLSDAVSLVLKSAEISIGGEITILKMKAIKISDLAQSMIELLAPKYGYKPEDVKIKEIGLRAGEKLYEALMTEEEAAAAKETDDMFIIDTMTNYLNNGNNKNKIHKEKYKSDKPKLLSKDEIKSLLIEKKLVAK